MTEVHLINHTHWDREWFLTHEYTTAWVAPLIDSLEALAAQNSDYRFLFDGQTLAIEDLLLARPDYRERVRELVSAGQLEIGPCYSQPDWRITSGELLVRNLRYGLADASSLGGAPGAAWLVDTFGHISQAPQLLCQAGLDSAYVWRGVPQMVPLFRWQGADGTELNTIDLFGGYRNLYGVTKTPDIAVERLVAEVDKLAPRYEGLPVPLFDGYDLDTEPEDPASYYADLEVPDRIALRASSPGDYADAVADCASPAPIISGELLSGKYGATFPGSLSSRTYLKVLHHDCEVALHRRLEPLAVLAEQAGAMVDWAMVESANRTLLQNAVHDCICGVSIDQVHERMERSYRQMLEWADRTQTELAASALAGFAPGRYAVSSNAMTTHSVMRVDGAACELRTGGIGVWGVANVAAVRPVDSRVARFEWTNDHFDAVVDQSGVTVKGFGRVARLVVRRDDGDTYSSEPGPVLGELAPTSAPVHLDESDLDATLRTTWALAGDGFEVAATIDLRFDGSPVIDLVVTLDSNGVGFRVDIEFETSVVASTVHASMPFDIVQRPHVDSDLLPIDIEPELAAVLMGQREVETVTEFPFHDYVALSADGTTCAVLAKGPRAYESSADGTISVALRRSVEWLAKSGLRLRSGDAGPSMYVPGARCERVVEHRLAFAAVAGGLDCLTALNEAWQNPPIVADVAGTPSAAATEWSMLSVEAPVAACLRENGETLVRIFNPGDEGLALEAPFRRRSLIGGELEQAVAIGPKEIVTMVATSPSFPGPAIGATVDVLTPIMSRVDVDRSRPDDLELVSLETQIAALSGALEDNDRALATSEAGPERYRLLHNEYVLDRERLELALSLELNRRRAATDAAVSIPDEPDPTIASLGAELNELRVKRRIYDYVVQALGDD